MSYQYNFEKDNIPKSYTRASWWDLHPDRIPSDFGEVPRNQYPNYKLMTPEEESAYLDSRPEDCPW